MHSSPRPAAPDRLSPDEELTLREHYAGGTGPVGGGTAGTDRTDTVLIDTGRSGTDLTGGDRAGRGTGDGTMTRSEERITVDSVTEPWARAVLRIEEVTEEVMVPVTITRQQARIEYLPLRGTDGIIDRRPGAGDGPRGDASPSAGRVGAAADAGRDRGDGTGEWVTLYGEQPVVTMERVPIERVRLATSWVTEQRAVSDRVRREEIELTTDSPLA